MSKEIKSFELKNSGIQIELLENGNIKDIFKGDTRIKQLLSNNVEASANNIFMKVIIEEKIYVTSLLGPLSPSKFYLGNHSALYKGVFHNVNYTVKLSVVNDSVFFDVELDKTEGVKAYIYYGMDISIANKYAVRNNEAYVCQYIDHKAFLNEFGYQVCSRQNQGVHTYLEQGSFDYVSSYSTDGFDFFKEKYRFNNIPDALFDNELSNRVYQYEFAYIALQSSLLDLSSNKSMTFYLSMKDEIENQIKQPLLRETALNDYEQIKEDDYKEVSLDLSICFDDIFTSSPFSKEEINEFYPKRDFEEIKNDDLLSFFLENKSYVTMQEKEYFLERPTGNMIISGNYLNFEETLANTSYMNGVFNSQIVCGNTSFNKLSSNVRNPLNVQKISGMRIFINIEDEYKLLAMPSCFEAGLNYSKWIYKINEDYLVIKTYMSSTESKLITNIKSMNNKEYDLIITNEITLGPNEHEFDINYIKTGKEIIFQPSKDGMHKGKYPFACFGMYLDKDFTLVDDKIFYTDSVSRDENLVNFKLTTSDLNIVTIGNNFASKMDYLYESFSTETSNYLEKIKHLIGDINFTYTNCDKYQKEFSSYNYLLYWYANNSLIHYSSPHGLEQYNGAAWGSRDLCQGPAEFFLSTGNFSEVRRIIINLFKHQYNTNGNWPQWFMFDEFYQIQQRESHGDIIVWPARLVGLYIEQTGDYEILNEKIPYTDFETVLFTEEKPTLLTHLKLEISNIKKSFIKGTSLSCYGGGDWDDTLQPANQELTKSMVSGWTTSLTFDMLNHLSKAVSNVDKKYSEELISLSLDVKADYNKYVVIDNIPAGFVIFDENNNVEPIIHPRDTTTSMKYRLLPFNRGIISGLFNKDEQEKALEVIKDKLTFPDGVRLMDKTVTYKGGENTYFQRAETGANFGREIGLQYCHAHIRYCEALGKVGKEKEFLHGLSVINPVIINEEVKNAELRQRNSYFSSSDGDFINRYDAMENYGKLKTGEVKVKAGWRVYSSGPGIYTYQVFNNLLGIKYKGNDICFDPILPKDASSFEVELSIQGNLHTIKYVNSGKKEVITASVTYKETLKETYRTGGILVPRSKLGKIIEIHF